jgi:hypothetical protein
MWEASGRSDDPLFLVIANQFLPPPPERLIVHGELLMAEDATPAGVVLALHAPTRDMLAGDAEILDWEFGGRR